MYDKSELCSKLKKIYCSDVKRIPECDEDRTKLCMQYSHQRLATIEKLKDLINYLEINRYSFCTFSREECFHINAS